MRGALPILLWLAIAATLGAAGWTLLEPFPGLIPLGQALTGLAPAIYLAAWAGRIERADSRAAAHLVVSISAGLGMVLVMVAVWRYGDALRWTVLPGLAVLVLWLLNLKMVLRPRGR